LNYQGLEEETLDKNSPGPAGYGLVQRASFSLTIKTQEMLKSQTSTLGNQKQRGMEFGFRKTVAAVKQNR